MRLRDRSAPLLLTALTIASVVRCVVELQSRLELRRQTSRQSGRPVRPLVQLATLSEFERLPQLADEEPQDSPTPPRRSQRQWRETQESQPPPLPVADSHGSHGSHDSQSSDGDSGVLRTWPFPVVLLTANRGAALNRTLASLLAVRGLNASQLFVVQDGVEPSVAEAVRWHAARGAPLRLVQHPLGRGARRPMGTASVQQRGQAVARAYKWALSHAFDVLTDDEAVVVVEDDLLFSPDLMEYFLAGWHVQRADPTLWCTSAWHDNGFGNTATDPKRLLRTGFFPGLGWLLTRALYKGELEPAWPDEHWDHWMRSEVKFRTSRGRECLIPQVPRTYHHGEQGTFMIKRMHELYFARIAHNTDPRVTWPTSEWPALRARLRHDGYVRHTLRVRVQVGLG